MVRWPLLSQRFVLMSALCVTLRFKSGNNNNNNNNNYYYYYYYYYLLFNQRINYDPDNIDLIFFV